MDENQGVGFYLDRTLKRITSAYLKVFKDSGLDLTIEQWVTLKRIHNLGEDASQVEVSNNNYRNRATTSRLIAGLQNKGLVKKERFEGDKKRYKLVITAKGISLIAKAMPLVNELREVGYKDLTEEEHSLFIKLLDRLSKNYEDFEYSQ